MQLTLLSADETGEKIRQFISDYDEFHWAVAWGTMTDVAEMLLGHPEKFRYVTFGITFCQTDPSLVEKLIGVGGARIVTTIPNGTYHPKIYGFKSEDKAAAIVGSANFTAGGLSKNLEATILIEGDANDPFFNGIFEFARRSARLGVPVTKELSDQYRTSYDRVSTLTNPPREPMRCLFNAKANTFPFLATTWNDYVQKVRNSKNHDVEKSLELLRIAQTWFASVRSFSNLQLAQRQAIAGLVVEQSKRVESNFNRDWGWFGSMRGSGDFAHAIIENNQHIASAIDIIPRKGEVTRAHFTKFVNHFRIAFKDSSRTGNYPTASRLLAMKRPDVFLCICSPNIEKASKAFGFSRANLNLDNYWDAVVDIIRGSNWYRADKPDGDDGELWEYRVAMLDTLFYQPE